MADLLRRPGPCLLHFPIEIRLKGVAQAGGRIVGRLNRSAAVKVVFVPLIGRPILPSKFLKPSNEPHAGLSHSCSHGNILELHLQANILQGFMARSELRHTSSLWRPLA
jgi:hypothetical protein